MKINEVTNKILLLLGNASEDRIELLLNSNLYKIKKYLNIEMTEIISEGEINDNIAFALIQSTIEAYKMYDSDIKKGISAKTQGQRTISYNTAEIQGLSKEIKDMLPTPKIRLR